jgi:Pectate lyase superfamily protein
MAVVMVRAGLATASLALLLGCTDGDGPRPLPQSRPIGTPTTVEPPPPVVVDPAPPREPEGGVVTPEQFGAVGDGVTDDTTALQEALDAAAVSDGRVVLGAERTYLLDRSLVLPTGAHLTGQGPSSVLRFTWRRNDPEHDGFYLGNEDQTGEGNTDITLEDFAIRGAAPGVPAGPKEIQPDSNVPAIRLRLVDRFRIARLDVGFAPGISIIHQGCSNGAIVDNTIHHSGRDGINSTWHHRNMHDILIADNRITKVGDDGVAIIGAPGEAVNRESLPYRVVVRDNVIRGWRSNPNGLALGRGISVLAATRVRLEGNLIRRTHSAGILVGPSTRDFSVDPANGVPWRSSHIQIAGNRVVEAGQNYVGSSPPVDEPGHDGIVVKQSDHVWVGGNKVLRPFGALVTFHDCHRCTGQGADEPRQEQLPR